MYILLVFLALTSVRAHDINIGSSPGGKKVFDEHFQASPAVWRQAQNVTINTTDDEIISYIKVTDLREEKDGDAKIVDGGQGQKKVTIELKSPTVLRGYDFHVEVYAVENKEFQTNPLNKNGPVHADEFKTNTGDLKSPNTGSKVTTANLDMTTKLPAAPKPQSLPSITEVNAQGNTRATRDAGIKKQEENKPKIDAPSVIGLQSKDTTTVKLGKNSNIPVTVSTRLFTQDFEDEENTTKSVLKTPSNNRTTRDAEVKKQEENKPKINAPSVIGHPTKDATTAKLDKYSNTPVTVSSSLFTEDSEEDDKTRKTLLKTDTHNDETRHVRDTQDIGTTPKDLPKSGSFDSKTITTTFKTPSSNYANKNSPTIGQPALITNDRDARATPKEDEKSNPTLVPSQHNPTVYTPNFEGNFPTLLKDAETNKKDESSNNKNTNDQKRNARETHDETKGIETPKMLANDFKNAANVTKDEERKPRGVEERPKITPNFEDDKGVSTTSKSFDTKTAENDSEKDNDKQHALNPSVLTKGQNFPVPYPYETTPKLTTTTKSPHKRDTETSEQTKSDKTSFNPKSISGKTTQNGQKSPVVSLQ